MWAIDMNRCVSCSQVDDCPERKKILAVMSALQGELNAEDRAGRPSGVVIVACKR